MHNLVSLRQAEEAYRKIHIMVYRSMDGRALFKSKSEEAKKRTLESLDKKYVARRQYSPYIKEISKLRSNTSSSKHFILILY